MRCDSECKGQSDAVSGWDAVHESAVESASDQGINPGISRLLTSGPQGSNIRLPAHA